MSNKLYEYEKNEKVLTKDGPGIIIGVEFRKNTNGGPGCKQFRIQLGDGRIRHYNINNITRIEKDNQGAEIGN